MHNVGKKIVFGDLGLTWTSEPNQTFPCYAFTNLHTKHQELEDVDLTFAQWLRRKSLILCL
jgi:hypothetical protein